MEIMKRIAVIFPGIGYHCDKPLLYYSARLAASRGFEVRTITYHDMPQKVRGDRTKMQQSFELGLAQASEQLRSINWLAYSEILFIGKSVGTVIASAYASEHALAVRSILLTPLEETFRFVSTNAIAFHGTKDPWADTPAIREACRKTQIPLYLTEHANHSLETGDCLQDLGNLRLVIKQIDAFINTPLAGRRGSLQIRKCTKNDQIAVTTMYNDVTWYLNHHTNYPKWVYNDYPGYETVRLAIDKGELYGCFDGTRCVGALILNHDPQGTYDKAKWNVPLSTADYLVIHTMAVAPKQTRSHIGSELLAFAETQARNAGMLSLRLDCVPENTPARALFQKAGFHYVDTLDLGRGIDNIPAFALYEKPLAKWY